MIKLQNNFTTPEQSKRLLELGVPVDSADMYYKHTMLAPYIFIDGVLFSEYTKVEDIEPCWSVGRLIEILRICQKDELGYLSINIKMLVDKSLVERCIYDLAKTDRFDFTKLVI